MGRLEDGPLIHTIFMGLLKPDKCQMSSRISQLWFPEEELPAYEIKGATVWAVTLTFIVEGEGAGRIFFWIFIRLETVIGKSWEGIYQQKSLA